MILEKRTLIDFSALDKKADRDSRNFKELDKRLRQDGFVVYSLIGLDTNPNSNVEKHERWKSDTVRNASYYHKTFCNLRNFRFGEDITGPNRQIIYARADPQTDTHCELRQTTDYLIPLNAPAGTVWYMLKANRK